MTVRDIPLFYYGKEQSSLDTRILESYLKEPIAKVQLGPPLLVRRVVDELRKHAPPVDEDPGPRWDAIARAGELLDTAELGGLSPMEHARLVTLATGAPISDTRAALSELAGSLKGIRDAMTWQAPGGNSDVFRTRRVKYPDGRTFAWVPNGQVLGVVESSNHAAVQATWVQALAMGWCVFLRPGSDDPFTPWRILWALEKAGFPTQRLALVAGEHALVPAMLKVCDRTLAYGGASAAAIYGNDNRVLFNGVGASKVFVGREATDVEATANLLFEGISHSGGRKCICTSAVLTAGPNKPVFDLLTEKMASLQILDPLDPAARVPAWKHSGAPSAPARLISAHGTNFLKPDVVACDDPRKAPFGTELPGPWATWGELPADTDPVELLRNSLVVALLSTDRLLHERLLAEPSINKTFFGRLPTWHARSGAPHKGLLSSHLFVEKACFEGDPPA